MKLFSLASNMKISMFQKTISVNIKEQTYENDQCALEYPNKLLQWEKTEKQLFLVF